MSEATGSGLQVFGLSTRSTITDAAHSAAYGRAGTRAQLHTVRVSPLAIAPTASGWRATDGWEPLEAYVAERRVLRNGLGEDHHGFLIAPVPPQ